MYGSRFVGLAALVLSLAGCGPEEDYRYSPLPVRMDASLAGASCDGFGDCPMGHVCASYIAPDGTEGAQQCRLAGRICEEMGCPGSCLATRSATPRYWCAGKLP
jgi:hypothetical protein